ncbi:MAG: TetR/AcrR family transcriptional regulator [Bacteroidia bacterium]|nr:TetR/AcrR family transcriptional regulator [Bacteroidia bacterium]
MMLSIETFPLIPSSARKEEILEAARKLMSERGYRATSMRDLAESLHIKPASLYSHYKSKEDMLWEIALRCARAFHEQVLPLAKGTKSASSRLHDMICAHVAVIIELREASAIFFREWRNLEGERKSTYAAYIREYESAFSAMIEEGIDSGEFRDLNPVFSTYSILSSANWVQRWYQPEKGVAPQLIARQIADQGLYGLQFPVSPLR